MFAAYSLGLVAVTGLPFDLSRGAQLVSWTDAVGKAQVCLLPRDALLKGCLDHHPPKAFEQCMTS